VIFGTVSDETMGDELRVTVVATGLGRAPVVAARPQPLEVVRPIMTGTDNRAFAPPPVTGVPSAPWERDDVVNGPAVWRRPEARGGAIDDSVSDYSSSSAIPAFLRKQAD